MKSVVIPTEHGGWGFTLEPVLLGLLIVPGLPAAGLGIATIAAFLARRPLRLAVADVRRGRRLDRTGVAMGIVAGLFVIALVGLTLTWIHAAEPFWWPLAVAVPLVLVQLRFDLDGRGRELLPELLGPVALAAAAPMTVLAEGIGWEVALGAWLVLASRIVPSVLLVRVQIRRLKEQKFSIVSTHAAGLVGIAVVALAAGLGWAPWLSVIAAGAVAAWSSNSLSNPPVVARTLGWTQMVVGMVVVLAFGIGYHAQR